MAETLGEYEHGSVSMTECPAYTEAIHPISGWDEADKDAAERCFLEFFRAVCEDILLMMLAS